MSRIDDTFARLRSDGRTGLVTYVTAGDPDLDRSGEVLVTLALAGADVLEVGVPFSDPLGDGPVIQRASERALAGGATLARVLQLVNRVRLRIDAPMVLFTYANPLARMGYERFACEAAGAGVDGVLVLDLPAEEAGELRDRLAAHGLDTIFLLSPTSTAERIRLAASLGRGFLYGISRLGVTGARETLAAGAEALVSRIRAETDMPLAIGFGISTPGHVAAVGRLAEAAVVGSSLVSVVASHGASETLLPAVAAFVRWMKGGAPAGASAS
jgi:tryptophan synthase alpha chain